MFVTTDERVHLFSEETLSRMTTERLRLHLDRMLDAQRRLHQANEALRNKRKDVDMQISVIRRLRISALYRKAYTVRKESDG